MLAARCSPAAACRLAWLSRRCTAAGPLLPRRSSSNHTLSWGTAQTCRVELLPAAAAGTTPGTSPPAAAAGIVVGAANVDKHFMQLALEQAAAAAAVNEVPVGAVLVSAEGEVLAAAGNATEATSDPTAHAELLCVRAAAGRVGGWRLLDATLYVTLEPCPMCAGALLQARVGTVVYGARNPLLGADGSWIAMLPGAGGKGQSSIETGCTSRNSSSSGHGSSWDRDAIQASCCNGGSPELTTSSPGSVAAAAASAASPAQASPAGPAAEASPLAAAPARPHPFHPNMVVRRGVLAEECAALMKAFFRRRRQEAAAARQHAGDS